jgi:hypothetical protein
LKKQLSGGRTPCLRTFQSIQIDYIELPQVGSLKYLLVVADYLINWIKAIHFPNATANRIVKVLLESIIPCFRLIKNIDSDNWSHFMANVIKEPTKVLDIK